MKRKKNESGSNNSGLPSILSIDSRGPRPHPSEDLQVHPKPWRGACYSPLGDNSSEHSSVIASIKDRTAMRGPIPVTRILAVVAQHFALAEAIREGQQTKRAPRKEVVRELRGK